jgi:hypothetical protein
MPEGRRKKKHRVPEALRHLRRTLTEPMRLRVFREVFGRDPAFEDELDIFIEMYILEMYNAGWDEWPPEVRGNDRSSASDGDMQQL